VCSSDLYHLFLGLKKQMKGRHFSFDTKVIAAAEIWLDEQLSDFFLFEWLANVTTTGYEVY
jgi:hypothetical protein